MQQGLVRVLVRLAQHGSLPHGCRRARLRPYIEWRMPEKIWIAKRSNATQWLRVVKARLATETEIGRGKEKVLSRVVKQGGNRGEMFLYFIVIA